MKYTPHTQEEITAMLDILGISSVENLFDPIPADTRATSFNIPPGKSEFEVYDHIENLARKNNVSILHFLGGGYYDHYIPAVVDSLAQRGEFFTAYTPYQPEASQGTLQALFEYQTAICKLTEMEVSNASLYDGGTALAEAILMGLRITKRKKIIIDQGVNPLYRKIIQTYTQFLGYEIIELKTRNYTLDRETLAQHIDENLAALVVENPNFFGTVDDYSDIADMLHEQKALLIMSAYPIALGMIKTPGAMGADIMTGEGQCLGNPLQYGGPYLGIISTRKKYIRNIPGRIAGKTIDTNNKTAYVLTLQAREQHIKRQKATSNICSNQGLCALRALFFLTALGPRGFHDLARQNYDKACYMKKALTPIKEIHINTNLATFNSFIVELPYNANMFIDKMLEKGIAAGIPLGRYYTGMENQLLITITEKRSKHDMDTFAKTFEEIV